MELTVRYLVKTNLTSYELRIIDKTGLVGDLGSRCFPAEHGANATQAILRDIVSHSEGCPAHPPTGEPVTKAGDWIERAYPKDRAYTSKCSLGGLRFIAESSCFIVPQAVTSLENVSGLPCLAFARDGFTWPDPPKTEPFTSLAPLRRHGGKLNFSKRT